LRDIPVVNSQVERYEKERERRLDEIINKNPDLQDLADVCRQLGSLQNFELLKRGMATHGRPALYYYYRSTISFQDSSKIFSPYREKAGWHSIENLSVNPTMGFQKGDLRVVIQHGGMDEADYGLTCAKIPEGERL
jgi:hypothetical protein